MKKFPIDCTGCINSEDNPRKGNECPVNEKYKESHAVCSFKVTQAEQNEDLNNREKYYCPHHGWVAGWIIKRPVAGSSAPQYRFCPIKGCKYRRRGT
ncbi:MAG: hypothetical protein ACFFDN_43390 [Candidatus Hodarchaeota archaeon]